MQFETHESFSCTKRINKQLKWAVHSWNCWGITTGPTTCFQKVMPPPTKQGAPNKLDIRPAAKLLDSPQAVRHPAAQVADVRNAGHLVAATPGRLLDVMDSSTLLTPTLSLSR